MLHIVRVFSLVPVSNIKSGGHDNENKPKSINDTPLKDKAKA